MNDIRTECYDGMSKEQLQSKVESLVNAVLMCAAELADAHEKIGLLESKLQTCQFNRNSLEKENAELKAKLAAKQGYYGDRSNG